MTDKSTIRRIGLDKNDWNDRDDRNIKSWWDPSHMTFQFRHSAVRMSVHAHTIPLPQRYIPSTSFRRRILPRVSAKRGVTFPILFSQPAIRLFPRCIPSHSGACIPSFHNSRKSLRKSRLLTYKNR